MTCYIRRRTISTGAIRYDVRYRPGGRNTPVKHAGTFRTLEEANARLSHVRLSAAAGLKHERPPTRTAKPNRKPSRIYFIQDASGPIKIGITTGSLQIRLAYLQSGNPRKMRLLGSCEGGLDEEKELHKRFAHLRISRRSEWFVDDPDLRDLIAQVSA